MIIDFHTHIYPDKVALQTESYLKETLGEEMPFHGPMTLNGLLDCMARSCIDKSVAFCVAERAKVVKPANDFIIKAADDPRIIGFGTIMPDMDDAVEEVKRIRSKGLKGIKFHSIFQKMGADDERLFPIYEEMGNRLIALFHSGINPGHPESPPLTTPHSIREVKERFPKLKIVAAHLGGLGMLEESEKWLVGSDIFFDISWTPDIKALDVERLIPFFRKHGVEKILFATDYPTTIDPTVQIDWFRKLPLTDEEKEMILWKNAEKILMS